LCTGAPWGQQRKAAQGYQRCFLRYFHVVS